MKTFLLGLCFNFIAVTFSSPIVEHFWTPLSETIRIYEKERSKILSLVPSKSGNPYDSIPQGECYLKLIGSIKILKGLPPSELVKAMLLDDSDYFLIIVLYELEYDDGFFPFNQIWSFQRSREKHCGLNPALAVFRNFVTFFSHSVADLKPLKWVSPADLEAATNLLQLFQDFWNSRLKSLGKRILPLKEFKLWSQFIEDRLRFLGVFLSHRTEDLFVDANQRLVKDLIRGFLITTTSLQNFYLLVYHFRKQMGNIDSPNFPDNFDWLSWQSPIFLINFFGILASPKINRHIHYLNYDLCFLGIFEVKDFIKKNFKISPSSASIFGTFITKDNQDFKRYENLFPSVNRILLNAHKVSNNFY
jgi:hypothetical protein